MEEWKEYKLGEVCKSIADGDHMPPPKVNSGIPFVTISNIVDCRLDFSNTYYVPQEYYDSLDVKRKPQQGDTIYSVVGTFGKPVYIKDNKPFVFQRHIAILRPDESKIDPQFLFYMLLSPQFYRKADVMAIGAVQRTISLTSLRNATIQVPPIDIQKGVVDALRFIDDKIEVNRRINDNLEQQAQALFKSWFVDFEPFRDQPFVESELGMIPEGWKVVSLSAIADYINGLAMQKYRPIEGEKGLPVLKIKELGQGSTDDNSELCSPSLIGEKYIIDDGDIIFSWSGTLMVKVWCGGKCGLNQHLFVVEPKDYPHWFAYQWTKHHLDNFIHIAKDKAVTMGHIKRGELDKAKVVVPDGTSMAAIDSMMKPLHSQIISNKIESRRLAQLRDTLLPCLMSGELSMDGLKGQSAVSPGQRPGSKEHVSNETAL